MPAWGCPRCSWRAARAQGSGAHHDVSATILPRGTTRGQQHGHGWVGAAGTGQVDRGKAARGAHLRHGRACARMTAAPEAHVVVCVDVFHISRPTLLASACGAGPRSSWPRRGCRGCRGALWQRRVAACGPARGCPAWSARSTRRPQPCCKSDPDRSRFGAILCHAPGALHLTPSTSPPPAGGCAQSVALTPLLVARPRQAMMAPKACSSAGRAMLS